MTTRAQLGVRIHVSGFNGTIKYVGPVVNTTGVWLGVEWDDQSRGKHDGSKDGVSYFDCKVPGAGSFIRPSSHVQYGRSFLTALLAKYIEPLHGVADKEEVTLGSSNGAIKVEAVNLNKIRGNLATIENLRFASLDNELVAFADSAEEITRTCSNIESLDLSNSLMPSWEEVAKVTRNLHALSVLHLSRNRFTLLDNVISLTSAFDSLQELYLNRIMISWEEIILLISCMPALRLLELGYNRLTHLSLTSDEIDLSSSKLEYLNFDGNDLQDWTSIIATLALFPSLKHIILTGNDISSIPQPPMLEKPVPIRHLGLNHNRLEDWADIVQLQAWLPQLESLHISDNPLTDANTRTYRPLIIARIPSLLALNGTKITAKERTDSELFYMSQISRSGLLSDDEITRDNPLWEYLCNKHGKPQVMQQHKQRDTLSNKLIRVRISRTHSDTPHINSESPVFQNITVLPTMSLRVFKNKLMKILRTDDARQVSPQNMRYWLVVTDCQLIALHDSDEARDLSWCGIEDGSNILVFLPDALA